FAFGASIALQQRAAAHVPDAYALRGRLLVRLMRHPVWLAGLAASGAGFILQMIALRKGALVVVQPIMTVTLAFALALIALARRAGRHRPECAAFGAALAGLGPFPPVAPPSPDSPATARATAWWVLGAAVVAATSVAAITALRAGGSSRAARLGL